MSKLKFFPMWLVIIAFAFVLGCQTKVDSSEVINNFQPKVEAEATPKPTPTNNEPITIAAGGDIMLGSTFPNETRMPPNDGADSLKAVSPIFQAADIAFANLEGPMIDSGISTKCPPTSTKCFAFRVPTRYGKYLKEVDGALNLKFVVTNHKNGFIWTAVATEVTQQKLKTTDFEFPKDFELKK